MVPEKIWSIKEQHIFIYSRLSLSRTPRDSMKQFEISVLRHIRFADSGKQLIEQPPLTEWICNLTPKLRDILKILWKRGEIAPKEQFLLFSTIFYCLLVDLCVKTGTRFSFRDKRLFEISEFEITGVDCIIKCQVWNALPKDVERPVGAKLLLL